MRLAPGPRPRVRYTGAPCAGQLLGDTGFFYVRRDVPTGERQRLAPARVLPLKMACLVINDAARKAQMIDFAAARRMMVDGQVRTSDVTDLRLQAAMLEVPRERFLPDAQACLAYLDL